MVAVLLGSRRGLERFIESVPQIQTYYLYICTYAMAASSEVSTVTNKALFGEIQNHAKLPVTLPDVAVFGLSSPWPTQYR